MNPFSYRHRELYAEDIPVRSLAAKFGTPLYIYSRNYLREQYDALASAMSKVKPLICYSVKANSNGSVIKTFLNKGSGLDIVSGGELFRALKAGADPRKIVFAGVGKTADEIEYALRQDILFFTVESEQEAARISAVATRIHKTGRIAFRVNPDVDPKTHKYISTGKKESKFGLDLARTLKACDKAAALPGIEIAGLHMHVGSQILDPQPFADALKKLVGFCATLKAKYPTFKYIDIGGGIGIQYKPEQKPLDPKAYAAKVLPLLQKIGLSVIMEPGRNLVGNAGLLVGEVQYIKENAFRSFVVTNLGMNDLIRPALYDSYHEIVQVVKRAGKIHGDVVGPVCESGDFLAADRDLPKFVQGDLIAARSAGAYGFAMASSYNSRPRPAEIMVDGKKAYVIRERETWKDLVAKEIIL